MRRLLVALALASGGCASHPEVYTLPDPYYVELQTPLPEGEDQIERGQPNVVLDGLNHYVLSLPTKLLLWNWQALDHRLPEESQWLLERYLELNGMTSVKVRHNQYAPIGELRRLIANDDVGWPYRATFGAVGWLRYTLFPDRLFAGVPIIGGGDHFNPFTNTINVYSGDVTILLHEGGHAKDYLEREWKGTSFALMRILPGVDLLQEAHASTDAIQFLYCVGDLDNELRAYKTLIPAYSTYIAGYFQGGLLVTLPIVAAGHTGGRLRAWGRVSEEDFPRDSYLPEWCTELHPASPPLLAPDTLPEGGGNQEGSTDAEDTDRPGPDLSRDRFGLHSPPRGQEPR